MPPLAEHARWDYGSEGWGFESLRARRVSPHVSGPVLTLNFDVGRPPPSAWCSRGQNEAARCAWPFRVREDYGLVDGEAVLVEDGGPAAGSPSVWKPGPVACRRPLKVGWREPG